MPLNQLQEAALLEVLGAGPNFSAEVPFVVPTPRPYLVDLTYNGRTPADQEATRLRLLEKVEILYKILALLGIDMATAYQENYTLNWETERKLETLAYGNTAAMELVCRLA